MPFVYKQRIYVFTYFTKNIYGYPIKQVWRKMFFIKFVIQRYIVLFNKFGQFVIAKY